MSVSFDKAWLYPFVVNSKSSFFNYNRSLTTGTLGIRGRNLSTGFFLFVFFSAKDERVGLAADDIVGKDLEPEGYSGHCAPGFIWEQGQENTDDRHQGRTAGSQVDDAGCRGPFFRVGRGLAKLQSNF